MNVYNFSNNPLKPGIPTLQEQASKAMGIQTPTFTPEQPPQKDPYDIDFIMSDKPYVSPYEAIAEKFQPRMDPEKQKRYETRAGINALGQGLRQIFETVQERQGLNVQPRAFDNAPNQALAGLNQENENKLSAYDQMLMRAKMMSAEDQQRVRQFNDQIRFNAWKTKQDKKLKEDQMKFQQNQFDKKLEQDERIKKADREQREGANIRDNKTREDNIQLGYYKANLDYKAGKEKDDSKGYIHFTNRITNRNDAITLESAIALANAKKAAIESKHAADDAMRRNDIANQYSLYNRINKFLGSGMTQAEAKVLIQELYDKKTSLETRQFSENDIEAYSKRIDPYSGKPIGATKQNDDDQPVEGFTLFDANGNPIE